jgi:hypothetical protein
MVLVTEVPMLEPMIIGIAVLDETLLEQNKNLYQLMYERPPIISIRLCICVCIS